MEKCSLKRVRSPDDAAFIIQRKFHVNEKLMAARDNNRLKQIHSKTMNILFEAARNNTNKGNVEKLPLHHQIVLSGNGVIDLSQSCIEVDIPSQPSKVNCCESVAYLKSTCSNCIFTLCEECGYSCSECGKFLCRSCVSLFGCGTVDRPICEQCQVFKKIVD